MAHTRCSKNLKIVNYFFFNFCCWFVCFFLQIRVYIYRFNYLLLTLFFFFEFKFENCIFDQFVCYILGNANLWFCTPTLPYYNINREKCQPAMSFYNIVQLRSLPVSCKLILLALTVLNCLMYTFSSEIYFFVISR